MTDDVRMTEKMRKFANLMATGKYSQTEAYKIAYQPKNASAKSCHECASRLMKNVKVQAQIDKVRQPLADAEGITFASHLRRLKQLGDKAEGAGQHAAAITAEVWRGRAAGLYADRVRQEDLDKLTEDELEMVTRGKVPPRLKLA